MSTEEKQSIILHLFQLDKPQVEEAVGSVNAWQSIVNHSALKLLSVNRVQKELAGECLATTRKLIDLLTVLGHHRPHVLHLCHLDCLLRRHLPCPC